MSILYKQDDVIAYKKTDYCNSDFYPTLIDLLKVDFRSKSKNYIFIYTS